jgi:integrase
MRGIAQREAKPLLKEDLFRVLDAMGDSVKDARDRALLLIGFAGGFRRSELVGLDCADIEHIRQGVVITLRRSKTDQEGAGRKIGIPHGRTRHCPVVALDNWLSISGIDHGPVFRPVDRHGRMAAERLSGEAVSLIVKERVAAAGIDVSGFSGHSLRAGFATSATQAGVSSLKIRAQSRRTARYGLRPISRLANLSPLRRICQGQGNHPLMSDMPRPRPPYLHKETNRHGSIVWYVHMKGSPRARLRAAYGTKEFWAEYQAAMQGQPAPEKSGSRSGTLRWLSDEYRKSSAWGDLSVATRRQRENIFKHVLEAGGDEPFAEITRKDIIAGRERRKDTPAMANNFVKAMRGQFKWAIDVEYLTADPTRDVGRLKVKSEGIHTWTEDEVERFETRWPLGTRERVAFDVLLYTGLRRGDAVRLGRQHVDKASSRSEPRRPARRSTPRYCPCWKPVSRPGRRATWLSSSESAGNRWSRRASAPGSEKLASRPACPVRPTG